MKKWGFAVCITLALALCACGKTSTTYTVIKNNVNYLVNTEQKTISDGEHVYHYNFSGNESSYKMDVTYPDGSTYWFSKSGYSGLHKVSCRHRRWCTGAGNCPGLFAGCNKWDRSYNVRYY